MQFVVALMFCVAVLTPFAKFEVTDQNTTNSTTDSSATTSSINITDITTSSNGTSNGTEPEPVTTHSPEPNITTTEITSTEGNQTDTSSTNAETSTTDVTTVSTLPKTGSGGFNALSFIGGIVLCLGLAAIMYVGFKFYKSRSERNYQTF